MAGAVGTHACMHAAHPLEAYSSGTVRSPWFIPYTLLPVPCRPRRCAGFSGGMESSWSLPGGS